MDLREVVRTIGHRRASAGLPHSPDPPPRSESQDASGVAWPQRLEPLQAANTLIARVLHGR